MRVVIKGTKNIVEYKETREKMERLTAEFFAMHKAAYDNWEHGDPVKTWWDMDGNICIEYEDGKWWHYNKVGEIW